MRVYVATTAAAVKQLLSAPVTFEEYLTPDQFEFDAGVGEEEQEHLISLLAADDSIELNQGKAGLVIAADLQEEQLSESAFSLKFSQVAALLYSVDGEELSWFAPEEIEHQIDSWL